MNINQYIYIYICIYSGRRNIVKLFVNSLFVCDFGWFALCIAGCLLSLLEFNSCYTVVSISRSKLIQTDGLDEQTNGKMDGWTQK